LIVDYHIMANETDSQTVIPLADRLLIKFLISGWSFDKGFFNKEIIGKIS